MSPLPIDLDQESVQFEGTWYTRPELAQRIRGMLDSGEFAVSRPSQALEELTQVLGSLRTVAFRSTPELAEALTAVAARQGVTIGALIRDALARAVGQSAASSTGSGPATQYPASPPLHSPAPPHLPGASGKVPPNFTPSAPERSSEASPSVVVDAAAIAPEVLPLEGDPVDLTAKKNEKDDVERRWFGG